MHTSVIVCPPRRCQEPPSGGGGGAPVSVIKRNPWQAAGIGGGSEIIPSRIVRAPRKNGIRAVRENSVLMERSTAWKNHGSVVSHAAEGNSAKVVRFAGASAILARSDERRNGVLSVLRSPPLTSQVCDGMVVNYGVIISRKKKLYRKVKKSMYVHCTLYSSCLV